MLEEGSSQYESDAIAKESVSGFTVRALCPNSPSRGFRRPVTLHKTLWRPIYCSSGITPLFWAFLAMIGWFLALLIVGSKTFGKSSLS
jgi:hypothetical protein